MDFYYLKIGFLMSDLIRCPACNGVKTILGLGGMRKTCHECAGIGWAKSAETVSTPDGIAPSEVDQLKTDLAKMIEAYEALQEENKTLKAELKSLEKIAKKKANK